MNEKMKGSLVAYLVTAQGVSPFSPLYDFVVAVTTHVLLDVFRSTGHFGGMMI